ncbi:MAG TPA: hypothetical protein VK137_05645, partial [Planctomycetaceae bacterium]|nr:hypothetical protein [Planctomycetaceae bacterium]
WLFTADSGLNPYRIVGTSLPEGVSFGDQLDPPVRVRATGYFFKRYSYATVGDYHTAPLLLAKTLTRLAQPAGRTTNADSGRSRTLTIVACGVLAMFAASWLAMSVGARRRSRVSLPAMREQDSSEPPDFRGLDQWPR